MKKLHVRISGMHCDGCVATVRDALTRLTGVTAADVTLDAADVSFDESVCGAADVVVAVREAGEFEVIGFTTKDG